MILNLSYGEVEINKVKGKEFFINLGKLLSLIGELDLSFLADTTLSGEERGFKLINIIIHKITTLTDSYDQAMSFINNVLGGAVTIDELEVEDVIIVIKSIFDLYDVQNIIDLITKKK